MMWKAMMLTVCLLLAEVKAYDGPSYGVKLCGREFIRAVIFTCGGSRWRRSITSTDDPDADHYGSDIRDAAERLVLPVHPRFSLQQGGHEVYEFNQPVHPVISNDVLESLRASRRKGRDVVVGLSNACCKWGCSKSEISSLC